MDNPVISPQKETLYYKNYAMLKDKPLKYYIMDNLETHKTFLDKHFSFFDSEVKELLAERAIAKEVKAGEVIMRNGEYMLYMTLVARGTVKIYRENEDNGSVFLYHIEPGEACALSLVCGSKREASQVKMKAVTNATLLLVPIQVMENLMRTNKSWYQFVIETYRYRFEDLMASFDSVVFKKLDERLLEYLRNASKKNQGKPLELTHQQIADDLHSTREVITRLLKKLEEHKKIARKRTGISLLGN